MLLAIDSGNTNAVFAVYDGDLRRGEWRSARMSGKTADEYAVWLTQLMAMDGIDPKAIDAAIIANVVPAASYDLMKLCQRYFDCLPMVVGEPSVDLGIEVRVPNPEEVGADRLVNAVGAAETYDGPLIIVDFGTATTFDVVDGTGAYCGGAIAPGINLSLEALHSAAAKLPRVAVARPAKVIGTGTVSAMQAGIFWGYVGLIEGLVERISQEFGAKMSVVATGGLAPLFMGATDAIDHLDRDLTMRGLLAIYKRNAHT
jgi:type III pantothenate kinase